MRLSRQTIQKIESCEVRLDLVRYVALCRILGLKAGPLLGRLEEPSDEDDPLYLSEIALIISGYTYAKFPNCKSLCASLCATPLRGR